MGVGGTLLALVIDNFAVFLGQFGQIFMKEGNINKQKLKVVIGVIIMTIASILRIAVLPYADLVILSCSSATGIIFAIILSVTYLREKFVVSKDLPAILLILCGCITTVIFSNKKDQDYAWSEVRGLVFSREVFAYCLALCLNLTFSIASFFKLRQELRKFENRLDDLKFDQAKSLT